MQDFAKNYIKSYEGLGRWVKFLLNFLWAIPTNLYRLSKSIVKKDTIGAVLSVVLLIFCGWWVIAVIDFVTIALKDTINRHRDFSCFLDSGAAFIVTPLL